MRPLIGSLLFLAVGCTVSFEGRAGSAMHRARVMQSGDMPCFALQDNAETERYASRVVMVHVAFPQSAAMARDGKVMWSIGMAGPASEKSLQGNECITYGESPAGADVMTVPGALAYGVDYHVALNTALLKRGAAENRQYLSDFCLSIQPDGRIRVHDLWLGNRAEVPPQDACFALYRVP